jgi:nucleotide-binding universal stress UspA family protein
MYRHVLIALDGNASERVLPWIGRVALAPGGVVRLLATIEPATRCVVAGARTVAWVDQIEAAARGAALAYLQTLAARLREDGREVAVEARVGDVAGAVLEAARESGADLVAMAVPGPAGRRGFRKRRAVDEILRRSPMPVLIVRPAGPRAA